MEKTINTQQAAPIFNRMAYGLFILLALFSALFSKDYPTALGNFGIALIFDPFNQQVPFPQRPIYQKVWLFAHAGLALVGFILLLIL